VSRRIQRGEVLALVAKWKPRLLLDSWEIRVKLTRRLPPGWMAECSCLPEYLDAVIRVNPETTAVEDLEAVVVHELVHLHTWAIWELCEDAARGNEELLRRLEKAHETLTSTLQRVVMR